MKLRRPHVPYSVRVTVLARQIVEARLSWCFDKSFDELPDSKKINRMLTVLFHGERVHLDHDPALCNRQLDFRTKKYIPDANDPRFLIYRTQVEHDLKTRVRGDGAQLSDHAMLRKTKRIAKRIKSGKRPKYGVRR